MKFANAKLDLENYVVPNEINYLNTEKEKPRRAVRDLRRGQWAWDNVRRAAAVSSLDCERLLIHPVADDTALRSYVPAA